VARNRTTMSRELFSLLVACAQEEGRPVENPAGGRFIKKLSDEDADLMANGGVGEPVIITRYIRFIRIAHGTDVYFCVFGLPEPDEVPLALEIIEPTPGIFALSVLSAHVRPIRSRPGTNIQSFEIKQELDSQFLGNGDYDGHDLLNILGLFPNITIYRTIGGFTYLQNDERVLGAILVRTYIDGPVALDAETIMVFKRIFESDSELIPFRNILQSFIAVSWEIMILDIYRCVEHLYALPRVETLKVEISYKHTTKKLSEIIEERLSWRPKEAEAFESLVLMCNEAVVARMFAGLENIPEDNHASRCKTAVMELYNLRNTIVHYRQSHERIIKIDSKWNVIVREMLNVVAHLYNTKALEYFS